MDEGRHPREVGAPSLVATYPGGVKFNGSVGDDAAVPALRSILMTEATYTVTGMTCDHCVRSVRDEVAKIDGVVAVDVDLTTGRVTVQSGTAVDDDAVRAAVDEAGYELS
jgi:copper ion binding protein